MNDATSALKSAFEDKEASVDIIMSLSDDYYDRDTVGEKDRTRLGVIVKHKPVEIDLDEGQTP